ncbi:6-phosphofructokinase [Kiritimatiella glycovorans]|uniref:Pyrophosphate--fructose 6-phosphate 1-phosphotransferase n=1 Tax=Kiritimatiella glycovorans TaxID=1307763 RepID=A0A0G3EJL4_9BACT|nr:6-phosphofructokinase [Kiritimatiella glycovorans]AKJ64985.1 Pyrophosphate--fructose 6-phosphate 1-phosphotransferase [Kiritimatiella glycovorans]
MAAKKEQITGNMLIAQSGGPTAVINQSLVGAVLEAKNQDCIQRIYGARHGIQGILNEDFIDMKREPKKVLEQVAQTPSSALGSVRRKPTAEDCAKIFDVLQRYDVRYFFYIGGNDSAETAHIINEEARKAKYDLHCFHICKTIDNDLRQNDHTPGFGSAAKFVAQAFMGDNLDNRALPGVKINVVMGRHAGFLTAASALARQDEDDGPHLIYLPERPFRMTQFVRDVKATVKQYGRCVVAVSEGIADGNGTPIVQKNLKTGEKDSHGNVQLSGTGALGDILAAEIKDKTPIKRVRADTFGYLQRSFAGCVSEVDAAEARRVGEEAVRCAATGGKSGSIAIKRKNSKRYAVEYRRVPLKSVAKETRHMPDSFINKDGNDVTKRFIDYARPLLGEIPLMGRLKQVVVKKKD